MMGDVQEPVDPLVELQSNVKVLFHAFTELNKKVSENYLNAESKFDDLNKKVDNMKLDPELNNFDEFSKQFMSSLCERQTKAMNKLKDEIQHLDDTIKKHNEIKQLLDEINDELDGDVSPMVKLILTEKKTVLEKELNVVESLDELVDTYHQKKKLLETCIDKHELFNTIS